tara:strand:+ start:142 stop:945 length:804 start_codon:yes stop_codon:yes gene_type:complete
MKIHKSFLLLIFPFIVSADQPIMNMMPRWDGGYGWQILYESISRDNLLQADEVIGKGWTEDIHQLNFQGVYTWDRSIRVTVKIPYVLNAERENLINGQKINQTDQGLGDITIALPLKKYFNLMRRTGSWTLAPQVRIPTATKDGYDVWERAWGSAIFLGYETETRNYFFATGISYWMFDSNKDDFIHSSLDIGWNVKDNLQLLLENDFHDDSAGKNYYLVGPAIYWRQNDIRHYRFEFKREINPTGPDNKVDHIGGNKISIGVGFVY